MQDLFVLKKAHLDVESEMVRNSLAEDLGIAIDRLVVVNRYITQNLTDSEFHDSVFKVFAEKNADEVFFAWGDLLGAADRFIITEFLPGQFNMRADAARECLELIFEKFGARVKSQKIYLLPGTLDKLTEDDLSRIKKYLINPVEMREGSLAVTFEESPENRTMPETYGGFTDLDEAGLAAFHEAKALAMSLADLAAIQAYFKGKGRQIRETELRVLDTYWSDHCRHTTFHTILNEIRFEDEASLEYQTYGDYLALRKDLNREEKPQSLMDLATIGAKYLQAKGKVPDLDLSEEVNACSIKRTIATPEGPKDYLIMFKNETHNHPTEIEPFGGAATCLGGAIRDPLSGRSFVYQAMRVTGAADPTEATADTLPGKLPQKKITTTAARGYSSYGNQIGLAAGTVHEIYHPGYKAKRMEVGAVIGSAPLDHVRRQTPVAGNLVILVGGLTGRDGIGGATGSSKSHDTQSIETSGAEVQKGNAPTERKIQRLMRRNEVKELITRCNDFGAGGVSVAVGELADGLLIDLSAVPTKYKGLNATETAISESQERMAVVIAAENLDRFMAYLAEENLLGTVIAQVTDDRRLVMKWHGQTVCDIDRDFLDSAGAKQYQSVLVKKRGEPTAGEEPGREAAPEGGSFEAKINDMLLDLNNQSQKGLNELFDSTNGCASSVIPFGGLYQDTESSYMAAAIALDKGIAQDSSVMTYGFDPYLAERDQFKGAYLAVVESLGKMAAAGADIANVRLSFQEYFEKLGNDPTKWGKPFKSLLGALKAQLDYEVPAIGGKDSMSGTFNDLSVPPTLISFAVNTMKTDQLIVNTLSGKGSLYLLNSPVKDFAGITLPVPDAFKANCALIRSLNEAGLLTACDSAFRGMYMTLFNMAYGERAGFTLEESSLASIDGFTRQPADFIIAVKTPEGESLVPDALKGEYVHYLGEYNESGLAVIGDFKLSIEDALRVNSEKLGHVFSLNKHPGDLVPEITYPGRSYPPYRGPKIQGRPKALIMVLPGTNCEYDVERAFQKAGAQTSTFIFRNRDKADLQASVAEFTTALASSQILVIPGGFSAGDEPDGSGKFIANVLRNETIQAAVADLLKRRDGLIIGICNGFQALIKTGLVPYGEIREPDESMPLLTNNQAGKHMDTISRVRTASVNSPWLKYVQAGEVYAVPISHGEGRFMADEATMAELIANGQIITQYCDLEGRPTMAAPWNPNGSMLAVEGIVSPDGRVLGKMGHNERWEAGLMKNYRAAFDMQLFQAGVDYFRD